MGTIDTAKLARELKATRLVQRVRIRAYSGGNVSARLMEFRSGSYKCQIDIHENGRQSVIVGEGWISGDWIAFGENPMACSELGTSFAELTVPGIASRCFRHEMVSNEAVYHFAQQACLSVWLPKLGLKANELLVATPDHAVLNLRNREELAIIDAFSKLLELSGRFPLAG
jgi:hypothetical protein